MKRLRSIIAVAAAPALLPMPREMNLTGGECAVNGEPNVEAVASVPPEGYELSVRPDGVTIRHSDEAGLFYAKKTLGQLRAGTTAGTSSLRTAGAAYPLKEAEGGKLSPSAAFFPLRKRLFYGIIYLEVVHGR